MARDCWLERLWIPCRCNREKESNCHTEQKGNTKEVLRAAAYTKLWENEAKRCPPIGFTVPTITIT
eukprot:6361128-Amphidinium_carterae.1